MGFVVSFGGSVIFDKTGKYKSLEEFSFLNNYDNIIVVIGGGIKAREAIKNKKNNFIKDLEAIKITKQNAKYFASEIGYKYYELNCVSDFTNIPKGKVVLGGFLPGLTTDAIATLIAELKEYGFINVSNVKGVYDRDPNKYEDAVFYKKIDVDQLINIVLKTDKREPGTHTILDLFALFIIKRSKILTKIGSATELKNMLNKEEGNFTLVL